LIDYLITEYLMDYLSTAKDDSRNGMRELAALIFPDSGAKAVYFAPEPIHTVRRRRNSLTGADELAVF
jgi:hypothetical protein